MKSMLLTNFFRPVCGTVVNNNIIKSNRIPLDGLHCFYDICFFIVCWYDN